jgi:hypothetical protein
LISNAERLEIIGITRRDRHTMELRDRRDLCIARIHRSAPCSGDGEHLPEQ